MPLNLVQFNLRPIGTWLVIAIVVIAILAIGLKIVSKVISTWVRVAIIVGSLLVIAAAFCVLSTFLKSGEGPIW